MTSACSPLEEHLFRSFWAGNSFSVLVQALPLNELVFSQIPVFRRWGLSFKATCLTVSGKRSGCSLTVWIPVTIHCDAWPALSLSVAWNGSHHAPKGHVSYLSAHSHCICEHMSNSYIKAWECTGWNLWRKRTCLHSISLKLLEERMQPNSRRECYHHRHPANSQESLSLPLKPL